MANQDHHKTTLSLIDTVIDLCNKIFELCNKIRDKMSGTVWILTLVVGICVLIFLYIKYGFHKAVETGLKAVNIDLPSSHSETTLTIISSSENNIKRISGGNFLIPKGMLTSNDIFDLRRSAEDGNIEAQAEIAWKIFYDRQNVRLLNEISHPDIYHYLRAAVNSNNAKAQYIYGLMLLGRLRLSDAPINTSSMEGFRQLENSASQGYYLAKIALGDEYYRGAIIERDYYKAFSLFQDAAQEDESGFSYYNIGFCYEHGHGIEQNTDLAFENYRMSADKGDVNGRLKLATFYYLGIGAEKNYTKAFDLYRDIAHGERNGIAFYAMGICYLHGNGVDQNYQNAFESFKLSSEIGSDIGKIGLATCYYNGIGIEKNYDEAFRLYNESLQNDRTGRAFRAIGIYYDMGIGVEKDVQKAFDYFRIAAARGDIGGKLKLAAYYYDGFGVAQDYKKAIELFTDIAQDDESGQAFRMLGSCYEYGHGVEKNPQKAFEYYKLSAGRNDVGGRLKVASCYGEGIGVEQNHTKAFELFSDVEQYDESGWALRALGIYYKLGIGVEQNFPKAFICFKDSAGKGDSAGRVNLGICYFYGTGTEKNSAKAFDLFRDASQDDESGEAFRMMALCYDIGIAVEREPQKAFAYYSLSEQKGNIDGRFNLALCYYIGNGVAQNYAKAFELFSDVAQSERSERVFYMIGICYENGYGTERDKDKAARYFDLAKSIAQKP